MKNTKTATKVNGKASAEPAAATPLRAGSAELVAATLSGDLRDAVLDILRELREPWHKLTEKQQTYFALQVGDATRSLVERGVELIAAQDFPVIIVSLEQVAFKPKVIEAKLSFSAIGREVRHQLVDAQGKPVMIVVGDPALFLGARGAPKIDKDAPDLPLAAAFAAVDDADLQRPGNRADKGKRPHAVIDPHPEAREIGKVDGLAGHQDHAARFPPGQYGHADYELGRRVGQNERAAFLATARELGAVAAKAGDDEASNPFHPVSQRDQRAEWAAGWLAPEPGNNGGHVDPPPAPKRRGRPRRDPGARDLSL